MRKGLKILCTAFLLVLLMAAGGASVVTMGTQLLNLEDFERLLPQVQLQAV